MSILGGVFLLRANLMAQEQSLCDGRPHQNTVSIPWGPNDSMVKLEQMARERAERQVIDACGGSVESRTLVEDAQVVSDSVYLASQGIVTNFEILDKHPSRDFSFFVLTSRITAKRMTGKADPGFRVEASMDKPSYHDGETARITVRLTQPGYVYIFNVGSDDAISLLFPLHVGDTSDDNHVTSPEFRYPTDEQTNAGRRLRFKFDPKIESDVVTERMEILATKKPLDLNGSGIQEALRHPLYAGDTAMSTALGTVLATLGRGNITFAGVHYQVSRNIPQP
jgi:hypothetical protein